jgi:hypothetical protein
LNQGQEVGNSAAVYQSEAMTQSRVLYNKFKLAGIANWIEHGSHNNSLSINQEKLGWTTHYCAIWGFPKNQKMFIRMYVIFVEVDLATKKC